VAKYNLATNIPVATRKSVYRGRKKGTTKGEPEGAKVLRAKGLKVSKIAQAMGTSRRTVQRYLAA
jgi:predicted transposase YdaD